MNKKQIEQIYIYLENRQKNQFSEMLLKKLKKCKNDSERTYYIQKTINPVILRMIFKGDFV